MDDADEFAEDGQGRGSFAFVLEHFPALHEMLPPAALLRPFAYGFGHGNGCSTHPELVGREWLPSYGGRSFHSAQASLPDAFFAAGTRNAGGSEYMFAMWKAGQRTFYFQYQYVNFHVGEFYEGGRSTLVDCLRRWWGGARVVVWSCGIPCRL